MVDEPTVEDTISILRGLKERYEVYHGVTIHDGALVAAATLSNRYITDRFLPDKAIDLVDEACAMIRTEIDSMPTEMDEISRKIMQLEIEETALKKETDELSLSRLNEIKKELADLREKFGAMKTQWDNEKKSIHAESDIKSEIERVNAEIEKAQRNATTNTPPNSNTLLFPNSTKNSKKPKRTPAKRTRSFVTPLPKKKLPKSYRAGRVYPSQNLWKASVKRFYTLRILCISA